MSIIEITPQGKKYRCDVCGKEDFWGPDWWRYGSIAHEETCPNDMPHMCSEACKTEGLRRIKRGEWKLPVVAIHGYTSYVVRQKRGY